MVNLRKSTTYVPTPEGKETPTGISATVPNMVPDLRTLIRRNYNGQLVPVMNGQYSNEDFPALDRMDKTELAQFRMDLADEMVELKEKLHASAKEAEERLKDPESKKEI